MYEMGSPWVGGPWVRGPPSGRLRLIRRGSVVGPTFGTSACGGAPPQAPVGLHSGAIESRPFTNALKTGTPPVKSRIWTFPNVTASVVPSMLNIVTATKTRSVDWNVFVFWVYAASLYVSIRGEFRIDPLLSVML